MEKSKRKHRQDGLFGVQDQYERIRELGDQLEVLNDLIDFEIFRSDLVAAPKRSDGARGGHPVFDVVMMFKVLIIQALNEGRDAYRIVAISCQELEASQIIQSICHSEDFGCPAALGLTDRLILRPPFAP